MLYQEVLSARGSLVGNLPTGDRCLTYSVAVVPSWPALPVLLQGSSGDVGGLACNRDLNRTSTVYKEEEARATWAVGATKAGGVGTTLGSWSGVSRER